MVMCHLEASPFEAALDIKALVRFAAIEYALVASDLLSYVVESLDDFEAEFLSLLVLGDGDIFDMTNDAEVVNEFPFHNQGSRSDNPVAIVDAQQVVSAFSKCVHPVVSFVPLLFRDISNSCEHSQAV